MLCNALVCDGNHPRSLTNERFEHHAKLFIKKTRVILVMLSSLQCTPAADIIIGRYIQSLSSSDLATPENVRALETFATEFRTIIDFQTEEATSTAFSYCLDRILLDLKGPVSLTIHIFFIFST